MAGRPRTHFKNVYGIYKRLAALNKELAALRPERYAKELAGVTSHEEAEARAGSEIGGLWLKALRATWEQQGAVASLQYAIGERLAPADAAAIRAEFGDGIDEDDTADHVKG
jgi:hypothetical protein